MAQSGTTGHVIEGFAEDLGKMLGQARVKAEGWLGQRQAIVKNLTQLRDEASKLLTQLGHEVEGAVRRGRPAGGTKKRGPGRPPANAEAAAAVPKRRTMSAKARRAISRAQKKRWAAKKAAEKKK